MSEGILLELSGVFKSYGSGPTRQEVLQGVDFAIGKGEWVYVTGASGSGKSTFLNICGLLDSQDEGTVLFEGREVTGASVRMEIRATRIGFVFQDPCLIRELTVLENVALSGCLSGIDGSRASELAKLYLEKVELLDKIDRRPGELSGGERQRVAIARALARDPSLLLLDEPTGNLDLRLKDELDELLDRLFREEGISIVYVTHERGRKLSGRRVTCIEGGAIREVMGSWENQVKG